MEQFNLKKWLQDKSRKVVTRDRRPVRIVCWDAPTKNPIYGFVEGDDGITSWRKDGRFYNLIDNVDLFFANEEYEKHELTEFERTMIQFSHERNSLIQFDHTTEEINVCLYRYSKTLLNLARKEILKNLPKWKKFLDEYEELDSHVILLEDNERVVLTEYLEKGDYYIELDNLKTLPKEE